MAVLNTRNSQKKKISIKNLTDRRLPLSPDRIKRLSADIFKLLDSKQRILGLIFVGRGQIKGLNQKYHNRDSFTDVLAFDYNDTYADVIISLEAARENSRVYKTSYKDEVLLYIIHAILHLCGYNDLNPRARKKMFRKQDELLRRISPVPGPVGRYIS